jgi:hypothetical protein
VAGLSDRDIDHVAVSILPSLSWPRKVAYGLRHLRHAPPFLKHELLGSSYRLRQLRTWVNATSGSTPPRLHFVPHHASHVVGSFYVSPYESAALLSVDGSGEWATSWAGVGLAPFGDERALYDKVSRMFGVALRSASPRRGRRVSASPRRIPSEPRTHSPPAHEGRLSGHLGRRLPQ